MPRKRKPRKSRSKKLWRYDEATGQVVYLDGTRSWLLPYENGKMVTNQELRNGPKWRGNE